MTPMFRTSENGEETGRKWLKKAWRRQKSVKDRFLPVVEPQNHCPELRTTAFSTERISKIFFENSLAV